MTTGSNASINGTARLAGGLHVSLVPFGSFSLVYVPSVLLVRGDAASTARNVMASERLFRSGTVSHLISQITFLAELVLPSWLLIKGASVERRQQAAGA